MYQPIELAIAKLATGKNEAGEGRERALRMMNGKVDFGGLGWIEEGKTVALGKKI